MIWSETAENKWWNLYLMRNQLHDESLQDLIQPKKRLYPQDYSFAKMYVCVSDSQNIFNLKNDYRGQYV